MDDNNESLNVSMGTANMIGIVLSTMTFGEHYPTSIHLCEQDPQQVTYRGTPGNLLRPQPPVFLPDGQEATMETKAPGLETSCLRLYPDSAIYYRTVSTDLGEPRRLCDSQDLPWGAAGISGPSSPPSYSCDGCFDVSAFFLVVVQHWH